MRKFLVRATLGLLALILATVGAGVGYVWHLGNEIMSRADKAGWFDPAPSEAPMTALETTIQKSSWFSKPWDTREPVCSVVSSLWRSIINGEPKWPGISVSLANQINSALRRRDGGMLEDHLRRASLTCQIEGRFSDLQILRVYLRRARFSRSFDGAEAAAQGVFGKATADLGPEEMIRLAALFESPDLRDKPDEWDRRAAYIHERLND